MSTHFELVTGRLHDCDVCGARSVPCTMFPSAEDPFVCETCVKQMQAAFDDDRAHQAALQIDRLTAYAAECQATIVAFRKFVWGIERGAPNIPPRLDDVDRLIKTPIAGR